MTLIELQEILGERIKVANDLGLDDNQIKRENGKLHMDRSKVFADVKGCHTEVETPEIKDGFDVDIYVDANLIEVYINDGEYVVTNVVYGISNEIVTDVVYRMYTK